MDEQQEHQPDPSQEHQPDPSLHEIFAPSPSPAPAPKPRRWMLPALIGVYALSVLAAFAILLRGAPVSLDAKSAMLRRRGSFLTAAKEPGVAWMPIHGVISESASGRPWEHGMEQWNRHLEALADKPEVRAIVLEINSPGGSVGAVQELYDTIERIRKDKKKPVVTVVGDLAASGGFYLASATDKVVCHPGSLVGSIGVIFETMNAQHLLGKIGVSMNPVKSGKMKDIGSPARAMTPEERKLLQALIDDAYGQFVEAVAKGRNLPVEKVKPLADGRIFSGNQALHLGLVDQLGDSRDAILLAAKLANLPVEPGKLPKLYRDGESWESVFEMIDSRLGDLRPEARLFSMFPPMTEGLQYRWTGL